MNSMLIFLLCFVSFLLIFCLFLCLWLWFTRIEGRKLNEDLTELESELVSLRHYVHKVDQNLAYFMDKIESGIEKPKRKKKKGK